MKTIDVSIQDEYYSQVNNKFIPESACTPTSMAMACIYTGIRVVSAGSTFRFPTPYIVVPKGIMVDDYFTLMARSDLGLSIRKKLTPWAERDKVPPQEVHAVMSNLVNRIVGKSITKFIGKASLDDLEKEIKGDHPCVVSGTFTGAGHTVVLAGMRWTDSGKLVMIMIDDPYGAYPDYKNKNGNNVWLTVETFLNVWKGYYHQFRLEGF